jgi:hypothetical protein
MIARYCFVRLTSEHATEDGRRAVLMKLRTYLAGVPGLVRLTVGTPADESAARWDLSVVVRFGSLADLTAATATASWQRAFAELAVGAVVVKAWNFTCDDR